MFESVSSTNLNLSTSNTVIENIKCFVRCRPLNEKEKELCAGCIKVNDESHTIYVENKTENKNFENKPFSMDYVFKEDVEQERIFENVAKPILRGFLQGYNCTIFAYGQTGAGKTHTMMGPLEAIFDKSTPKHGLIPRILNYIFAEDLTEIKSILNVDKEISNFKMDIKCSCLEIYQEQIIDLLSSSTTHEESNKLAIREDSKKGMFIDGLTEMSVKNDKAAKEIIMLGLKNRHVAATSMNSESSRSHLIFTIFLNLSYTQPDDLIITRSSRLHLIDLAGSERQKATKAVGERIKEAGMINKSLSTLGNVINALVEMSEGKTKYVPFRDSKLTYFLKDSLGGNAKTTIIANISQSVIQTQETISTLKFVQRAKMIKNKAVVNENVNDTMKILQNEIKKLKDEILFNSSKMNKIIDFICPICKNDPNCINNHNPNNSFFENIQISTINSSINILLSKIEDLFTTENFLIDKLRLIDSEATPSIEKFFINKEIYESDYSRLINSLEVKLNQFNKMVNSKENIIDEVKLELEKFKSNDIINNIFIERINEFIDELIQFKSYFEVNDLLSLTKLKEENKQLKNEVEAMSHLQEYKNKSKDEFNLTKMKEFYQPQTVDKMSSIINDFMECNRDLKSFFFDNFGINNTKIDAYQYSLIEKTELERMTFQLEEFKINEDNNIKLIDDLQSENFLLNMELAKYKEGNILLSNEKNEENNSFKEIVNTSEFSLNDSPKGKSSNQNVNLFSTPHQENMDQNQSKSFIKNLRHSLIKNSPNRKMMHSSLLYSAQHPIYNQSTPFDNLIKRESISTSNLTRENFELIKLKEKLDDVLINIEDKNIEINTRDALIEDLNNLVENLKIDKEKLEFSIKQLKDEIDTLYDSNSVLTSDLILLNSNINSLNHAINKENIDINLTEILSNVENMNNIYQNDLEMIKKFYLDFYSKVIDINSKFKNKLDFYIAENKNLKSEIQNLNFLHNEEKEQIVRIVSNFKKERDFNLDLFKSIIYERILKNEINIDKIKEDVTDSLCLVINNAKFESENALHENQLFRTKIKIIFGDNFDFNKFFHEDNDSPSKILNWDKLKLNKLERRILELKEEKKILKTDIALLQVDFSKGLSDSSLNNKIHLLMRLKDENYNLKMSLNELKKKNEILEISLTKLQDSMDTVLSKPTNFTNFDIQNILTCNKTSNNHSDENYKMNREFKEIIEKVIQLDVKRKTKENKNKFIRALEILKNTQEIVELNKFHSDVKYKSPDKVFQTCEDFSEINLIEPIDLLREQYNTIHIGSPNDRLIKKSDFHSVKNQHSSSEKHVRSYVDTEVLSNIGSKSSAKTLFIKQNETLKNKFIKKNTYASPLTPVKKLQINPYTLNKNKTILRSTSNIPEVKKK